MEHVAGFFPPDYASFEPSRGFRLRGVFFHGEKGTKLARMLEVHLFVSSTYYKKSENHFSTIRS
jgi:hypothetical protein